MSDIDPSTNPSDDAWAKCVASSCEELSLALYAWARLRLANFGSPALQPEDVVQETWVRSIACPRPGGPPSDSELRGWVFGIAQNVLYETTRSLSVWRLAAVDSDADATSFFDRFEDTVTSVCTRLSRDESVERFFAFAEELDELDRGLLVRCALEGLSATDAGRRLDLTQSAAIKRWQRLRERLRDSNFASRLGLLVEEPAV